MNDAAHSKANPPPAVVVGLCAHGLAIVRALARQGVTTHALEANMLLPGTQTRHATVHFAPDINGPGLVDSLRELRRELGEDATPILFLTNDNMVTQVAERWPQLEGHYKLSWSESRGEITRLVMKSELQARCEAVGLPYPRTWRLERREALAELGKALSFPVIAKPVKPLSAFKVRVLESIAELERLVEEYASELPFLIQDWIPGDERRLSFCALYLEKGRVVGRFDGRKLRARPMGHTTVAEPVVDDATFAASMRFFEGLGITGPVSLELKRDDAGRLWVIEPTMGRTDFWLGCCIANGVNLPYIEYCHQARLPSGPVRQLQRYVWFNMDRDPVSPVWYLGQVLRGAVQARAGDFLYAARDDMRPFFASLTSSAGAYSRRVTTKVSREGKLKLAQFRGTLGMPAGMPGGAETDARPGPPPAFREAPGTRGWTLLPAAEFENHLDAWWALNEGPAGSPLLEPTFLAPLLKEFGTGGEMLALCRGKDGFEAAALLVSLGGGTWETFQPSQNPIGAWLQKRELSTEALVAGLLDSLPGLPLRVGITQQDPDLLPRPADGGAVATLDYIHTARVTIEGTFEDYWAKRGRNLRHNMKRQRSRLEKDGIRTTLEVLTAPGDVAQAIADYGELESAGWKAEGGTAVHPGNAQGRFYRAMLEGYCRLGQGRIYRYRFDDRVVAMDLCIEGDGSLIILKTAYDESIQILSPAFLMREESFRQLFEERRLARIEFYGKLMDWHTKWTDEVRDMYHVTYYRWPIWPKLRRTMRGISRAASGEEAGSAAKS